MPARGLRRASDSPLAARVGLTRERQTQLMHLLLLAPAIQEAILAGNSGRTSGGSGESCGSRRGTGTLELSL